MKSNKIIKNEKEITELFKKVYPKIFSDYSLFKEQYRIKFNKSHGFIDLILKHKKKEKYILIEFKFNRADTAIIQLNKYHMYFKKALSLSDSDVKKYIIDFKMDNEIKNLCKESNINYLCLKELPFFKDKEFKKSKTEAAKEKTKLTLSVDEEVLKEFKKLCEEEGWKLGKQIEKLMRGILEGR